MIFQKILDALKSKYSNVPKAVLERVAKILSKTCTEEDKITETVEGASDMVSEFADLVQKEGDRRVSEAQKKAQEKKDPTQTQDPPKSESKDDDMPAWAKSLLDSNKQLAEKLSTLEAEKTSQTFSQKVIAFAKEKGIPESFVNTMLKAKGQIKSEDEYNDFITLVETDGKTVATELGGGAPPPPIFGNKSNSGVSSAVENFLKEKDKKEDDPFSGKKI